MAELPRSVFCPAVTLEPF